MRKSIRLAMAVWWAVGLGGLTRADIELPDESDQPYLSDVRPSVHIGLLSQQDHQQLLSLLGERTLCVIGEPLVIDPPPPPPEVWKDMGISGVEVSTEPLRVPEPGMFTLLLLAGVTALGFVRPRKF